MLSQPYGIAYHAGNLYVTNSSAYSVTVYPAGAGRRPNPIVTISGENTELAIPQGIAVDSAGNIYVANQGVVNSEPASVTIYRAGDKGDVAPIGRISGLKTRLESPNALALDSHGYIYVVNESDSPKKPDRITIYAPGSNGDAAPVRVIAGPATLLSHPGGVAVDSNGNLFVTSSQNEGPVLLQRSSTGLCARRLRQYRFNRVDRRRLREAYHAERDRARFQWKCLRHEPRCSRP